LRREIHLTRFYFSIGSVFERPVRQAGMGREEQNFRRSFPFNKKIPSNREAAVAAFI
jgi:hypothetical protein